MIVRDECTNPKPWDAYKKVKNPDGTLQKVDWYNNGGLVFTWLYSYEDGIETGCQIIVY